MSATLPNCDRCGRFTADGHEDYDDWQPDPWNGPRTTLLCTRCRTRARRVLRMADEFTPTTAQVAAAYVGNRGTAYVVGGSYRNRVAAAQFSRWLAEHDRQVRAEAWDESAAAHGRFVARLISAASVDRELPYAPVNPYREVGR